MAGRPLFKGQRLLAIVDTVRAGDPFIADNARRLDAIAWSVLALEVLRMIVMTIGAAVWEPGRLGGFSFAPWLAVLMLFVLSGVFAQGARLRACNPAPAACCSLGKRILP